MKCLYLFSNAPLSENYNGGASRLTQKFNALIRSNIDVYVMRLLASPQKEKVLNYEQTQPAERLKHYHLAQSWHDVEYQNPPPYRFRPKGIFKGLFHPVSYAFPELGSLRAPLLQAIETIWPDFILTQMYPGGALLSTTPYNVPWIFGHEDWLYHYSDLRPLGVEKSPTLGSRFRSWARRNAEIAVARSSNLVITASSTEGDELRRLGMNQVYAIPATFESVAAPPENAWPQDPPRIVHFGQLSTSSNAIGLRDYLTQVAPHLPPNWELHVIGSLDGADPTLLDQLKKCGAVLCGRVDDLADVLRPFDIAIIPFQYNAGERTKVAQLFNYAQVVVSHEKAVAGTQYARSGENCILLSDLSDFPEALKRLAQDHHLRKRIGLEAKATFERELTLDAQLPKYQQAFMAVVKQV